MQDLHVEFHTYYGTVGALHGVDLVLRRSEILGLVGETGCGKSVCGLSILRCVPEPGKIVSGHILLENQELLEKSEIEMRSIRGHKISMIFQDPTSSLNPVLKIGVQLIDIITAHQTVSLREARAKAIESLRKVLLPDPEATLARYPHQLSRGMRQRVMIAMALSCNPAVLIADEPTTALDVTVQAQILKLIRTLRERTGASVLLITHDLGVVAETCDRVAVMYAGEIVETGDVRSVIKNPKHPYTMGLLNCIPKLTVKEQVLDVITGFLPDLTNPPMGCRFHPRCPYAMEVCRRHSPMLAQIEGDHRLACFLHHDKRKE